VVTNLALETGSLRRSGLEAPDYIFTIRWTQHLK